MRALHTRHKSAKSVHAVKASRYLGRRAGSKRNRDSIKRMALWLAFGINEAIPGAWKACHLHESGPFAYAVRSTQTPKPLNHRSTREPMHPFIYPCTEANNQRTDGSGSREFVSLSAREFMAFTPGFRSRRSHHRTYSTHSHHGRARLVVTQHCQLNQALQAGQYRNN